LPRPLSRACAVSKPPQGDPSIDALADSIESAWDSGEFKRAANLFHTARKISFTEFQNSYRLVSLLTEYLCSAKLYREGSLAADILVAVFPNLFQAHVLRARTLTMLRLWEGVAQEIAVIRRLQPTLKFLSAFEQEIAASAAKDAAASQGTRSRHFDGGEGSRGSTIGGDDSPALDSWANVLRGLVQKDCLPYVIFDTVVCSCFVVLYTYLCNVKAAAAKSTKVTAAPAAAAPVYIQPSAAFRRTRP
jgi:hypothetical protein